MTDKENPCKECKNIGLILVCENDVKYAECVSCGRHIKVATILNKNDLPEIEEQK